MQNALRPNPFIFCSWDSPSPQQTWVRGTQRPVQPRAPAPDPCWPLTPISHCPVLGLQPHWTPASAVKAQESPEPGEVPPRAPHLQWSPCYTLSRRLPVSYRLDDPAHHVLQRSPCVRWRPHAPAHHDHAPLGTPLSPSQPLRPFQCFWPWMNKTAMATQVQVFSWT